MEMKLQENIEYTLIHKKLLTTALHIFLANIYYEIYYMMNHLVRLLNLDPTCQYTLFLFFFQVHKHYLEQ